MMKIALLAVAIGLLAIQVRAQGDHDTYADVFGNQTEQFDWDIFKVFAKERVGSKNVMLSPISLKIALQILYEAASSKTADQIQNAFGGLGKDETRAKYTKILDSLLKTSNLYELKVGSRMYLDSAVTAQQKYKAILDNNYRCKVEPFNPANVPKTVDEINQWVADLTKGNIKGLVGREDMENTVILLLNAMYFHGSWENQFMANKTKPGKFSVTAGNSLQVEYMTQTNKFMFHVSKSLEAKIIRLPYQGNKYAMYIVLPDSINGIEKVVNEINPSVLKRAIYMMDETNVKLTMPKFKFNHLAKLVPALQKLGIEDLFTTNASLGYISHRRNLPVQLRVSNIIQKSGVDVNELGTVAFAATEVQLVNKFGEDDYIEELTVKHPFMFFIEDRETSQILFIGKVENPTDNGGDQQLASTVNNQPESKNPRPVPK